MNECRLDWGITNHLLLILAKIITDEKNIGNFIKNEYGDAGEQLIENSARLDHVRNYILRQQEQADKNILYSGRKK